MNTIKRVALIIEMSNAYGRGLLRGIRAYIDEHEEWSVHYGEYRRGEPPPGWLKGWRGDGIIARIENPQIATALRRARAPIVDVSAARLLPKLPCLEVDNQAVANLAAEHLLERGFKHFGFCGVAGFNWSDGRRDYFTRRITRSGFVCDVYPHRATGRSTTDQWVQDIDQILRWVRALPKPVGILSAWDGRGLQVLDACRQLRLEVPDDVAVLGVDDDELICALGDPPLSSVVNDPYRAGYMAAAMLEKLMSGGKVEPGVRWIKPLGVTLRRSTDVMVTRDPLVSRAVQLIRHRTCEGVRVDDVLRVVGISRSQLDRRFRTVMGRTAHDEITRVRLGRVRELLETTDLSLGQIARRAGFRHAEYMSYAFSHAFGVSPSAHRKRQKSRGS